MAESWHALPVQDAFQRLDSGPLGLDARDVRERLVRYGPNEIVQLRKISRLRILLSQFLDLLVVVLLVAAFLSAAIGLVQGTVEELYDAVVILVIVGFNAIFGFFPEYRAGKGVQALTGRAARGAASAAAARPPREDAWHRRPGDLRDGLLGRLPSESRRDREDLPDRRELGGGGDP